MRAIFTALLFVAAAPFARPSPILHGEGTEQLTANDVRDIEDLGAEILPGRPLAVIDSVVRKDGEHAGEVSLLHVFAEPDEQTSRIWRGRFFKCVPEFAYHPPKLPDTASDQMRFLNLKMHKRGRWIVQFADPNEHYAVIGEAGKMLPGFSAHFLDHYSPFRIGRETNSKDAVAAYDFVMTAGQSYMQHPGELEKQPVHFLQTSSERATVHLGKFKFQLKRANSQWQIDNLKAYGAVFGGIVRQTDNPTHKIVTKSVDSGNEDAPEDR